MGIKKTVSDLRWIVFMGGSLVINAKDYKVSEIKSIVFTAKHHNAKVFIKNAICLTTEDCKSIAFTGGKDGNVTFDFSDYDFSD